MYFQLEMAQFPCRTGVCQKAGCFSSLLKMQNLCKSDLLTSLLGGRTFFILEFSNQEVVCAELLNTGLQKSPKLNQISIKLKEGEEKVFKTQSSG